LFKKKEKKRKAKEDKGSSRLLTANFDGKTRTNAQTRTIDAFVSS